MDEYLAIKNFYENFYNRIRDKYDKSHRVHMYCIDQNKIVLTYTHPEIKVAYPHHNDHLVGQWGCCNIGYVKIIEKRCVDVVVVNSSVVSSQFDVKLNTF